MGAVNQNRSYERGSGPWRHWSLRCSKNGPLPMRTLTNSLALAVIAGVVTACSTTTSRPHERPTADIGAKTTCPGAGGIAKALSTQSSYWRPADTVTAGTITCAGAYVTAGVTSAPQPFRVLLKREGSGLKLLGTGTGPICSIFRSDANTGMVVVPKQYGQALECLTSH